MFNRPVIRVETPRVAGSRVTFPFTCSPRLQRYFHEFKLDVTYDVDVKDVPPSLLTVPIVANLITVAWAAGANLHVDTLDANFLRSLDAVKNVFQKWYPKLPFTTTIHVEQVKPNQFNHTRYGLLFSGGIDSTCSYIANIPHKPDLIMIGGTEPPWLVGNDEQTTAFWTRLQSVYHRFAAREGVDIHFINSNMRAFLNEAQLNHDYGYYLSGGGWWTDYHHPAALRGLCAPVTTVKHIGTLINASSGTDLMTQPYGNHPEICGKVAWASLEAVYHGFPLSKPEKIRRYLKPYLANHAPPTLRVCWAQIKDMNCIDCYKCLYSSMLLVLEGIDPNTCGFTADASTFATFQRYLVDHLPAFSTNRLFDWRTIQDDLPDDLGQFSYVGAEDFLRWFRHVDMPVEGKKKPFLIRFTPVVLRRYMPDGIKQYVRRHILKEDVDAD